MEKPACGTKKRNGKTSENSRKKMGRKHTHNTFGFKIVFLKINLIRLRNSNDFNLPHFDHAPWRPEFRLRTATTFILLRRRWTVLSTGGDRGLLVLVGSRLFSHPAELVIKIGELLLEAVIDLDVSLLPDVP